MNESHVDDDFLRFQNLYRNSSFLREFSRSGVTKDTFFVKPEYVECDLLQK